MSALEARRGRTLETHHSRALLTLARVAVATGLVGLALGATLAWRMSGIEVRTLAELWVRAEVNRHLNPIAIFQAQRQAGFIVEGETPEHVAAMTIFRRMLFAGLLMAAPLATGMTLLVRRRWIHIAQEASLDDVKRGNRLATPRELAMLVHRRAKSPNPILIGGVPVPVSDEQRHMLLAGRSGSGKTTVLHAHVRQVEQRGEHVLLFDPDGSYISAFYRPERGDIIINPWDDRSARWTMLADVHDLADAQRIAAVLIPKPPGTGEAAMWYESARLVCAHIIHHLARTGRASLDDLAATLNTASADELRVIVSGTPAARMFEVHGERATASVLFMLSIAARTVATLASIPASAPAFSFDAFYAGLDNHDGAKPFIFLAAPRRYREAGAPIIAAALDAAASALLQREPGQGTNTWLILDELASLPPVQSLLTLLPEGRKYRVGVTIAFQAIAQLRQTYTDPGAEIITGQAATRVLMAVGDPATAKWAVELAGMVEVENQRASETLGADKDGRGSLASHRERKSLLVDAEISNLQTGQAYLHLAGYPLALVTIDPPQDRPAIAPGFVPVTRTIGEAVTMPVATPATRIEDRDDWLTAGGC